MKRILLLLFGSVIIFSVSCVKEAVQNPDQSVSLTYDTLRMVKGNSQQLSSKNFPANELKWSSSDTTIVSVDANGLVLAKKSGKANINVQSKTAAVAARCVVMVTDTPAPPATGGSTSADGKITFLDIKAIDIGIGANGSVFIVTADSLTAGGHAIAKYNDGKLSKLPDCGAMRVAVSPQGMPWVVDYAGHILKYNGSNWDLLPGLATDIGIGADGSVFAIGREVASYTGGFNIMKWTGNAWQTLPDCAGIRIAVSPNGIPWVVNKLNIVYQYSGNYLWNPWYGVSGTDIGISANGAIYVAAQNITSGSKGNEAALYKYMVDGSWTAVPNAAATNVAVTPQGLPWWTNSAFALYKLNQ